MGVFIKDMKIPESCEDCRFGYEDDAAWMTCIPQQTSVMKESVNGIRHPDCPLVEVPAPHSRLLDENDVIDAIHDRLHELQTHKEFQKKHGDIDLLGVMPYIAKVQPVIEAEGTE